jgi:hypothetical protein
MSATDQTVATRPVEHDASSAPSISGVSTKWFGNTIAGHAEGAERLGNATTVWNDRGACRHDQ